jgi:endonuclease/exonuclease/phosphatase family metal-dependent hydrolase
MLFPKCVGFLSCFVSAALFVSSAPAQTPVVVETNTVVRVMASNLSSGNYQRYEGPGLRILQGLKPDVVAIQEFNYASTNGLGTSTPAAIREMIDATFGTNYSYYRETVSGYTIPNGIISRYPIASAGTWDDTTTINDRGFAWARIRLPGTNDLYVVSVHLKANSTTDDYLKRATEATNLTALIRANFPAGAWIIVAGDLNLHSATEACITQFKTYLSDSPMPNDGGMPAPNANTSEPRSQRYDYVLPSFSFTNCLTPVTLPSRTFVDGLVFDSAVYTALSDVSPVASGDSHVTGMQHMGVVKDFKISYLVTNYVEGLPLITLQPQGQTVVEDGTAFFEVQVESPTEVSYQWRFGNVPIPEATSSTYTRTNVGAGDEGNYSVAVTNSVWGVISSNALLSVILRPGIVTPPASQSVNQGADAAFTVVASGSAPLSYQWQFNAAPIACATGSTYTRTNVQLADRGSYSVLVTNRAGLRLSPAADLTLNIPPPFITTPAPGVLTWTGLSNLVYTVEMKSSLAQTNWEIIGNAISSGNQVWFTNSISGTQQFFRVIYP